MFLSEDRAALGRLSIAAWVTRNPGAEGEVQLRRFPAAVAKVPLPIGSVKTSLQPVVFTSYTCTRCGFSGTWPAKSQKTCLWIAFRALPDWIFGLGIRMHSVRLSLGWGGGKARGCGDRGKGDGFCFPGWAWSRSILAGICLCLWRPVWSLPQAERECGELDQTSISINKQI